MTRYGDSRTGLNSRANNATRNVVASSSSKSKKVTPQQLLNEALGGGANRNKSNTVAGGVVANALNISGDLAKGWSPENLAALQDALVASGYLPAKWAGNQDRFLAAWADYRNARRKGEVPQINWRQYRDNPLSSTSSGGGSGGGGGRAAPPPPPTFEELRDNITTFYEGFVGTEASGEVQDHIYRRLLGGSSFESIENEIQDSAEFRKRFPGIENARHLNGPAYDDLMRPFEAHSLENRGRILSDDEKRSLLTIGSEQEKQQWINNVVSDGANNIQNVFSRNSFSVEGVE